MAEENEGASKTEEPTPQKLQKAREKGDVAKTQDLSGVFVLASTAAVLTALGGWMARNIAIAMLPFLEHPDQYSLHGGGGLAVAKKALSACAPVMLILLLVASIAGVAGHLVQTGVMFTPEKLKPDWKKVSPMGGLKRMFGLDSLIQFARSLLKVVVTAWVAWWAVRPHAAELQNLAALEPAAILPFCVSLLKRLVFAVVGLLLVIAAADWLIQKQRWMARMRMTKEEVKEDYKQTEGDPHVKARQRQLRHERARRRMMQAVPNATVVVMNPTHYAVALRYNQGEDDAPVCVAKGLDALALKIRAVAEEAGVPVVEDPPLARALYAAVDLDEMIPTAHYEAVAKVIGFILNAGRRVAARPL